MVRAIPILRWQVSAGATSSRALHVVTRRSSQARTFSSSAGSRSYLRPSLPTRWVMGVLGRTMARGAGSRLGQAVGSHTARAAGSRPARAAGSHTARAAGSHTARAMAELRRSKKVVLIHRVLWTTFLLILLVGADYLLGFVNDTRQIRETSRLFREEVAPLQIHTLNLVPNL